ncbi:MAG: hypothetical protein L3K26_15025 [Candidatus Hydrogenedentes bacterium]|nr:hypothetical protein [Candidatus Hydrogenedentota bacterium]
MNTTTSAMNGKTFTTSPKGKQLEYIRTYVVGLFIVAGASLASSMPDSLWYWLTFLLSLIPYSGAAFLIHRYLAPPTWLRTEITVDGEHIRLVRGIDTKRLPLEKVKRIKIERARSGKHRAVKLWNKTGEKYVLLDPADGDLLEDWAAEEAGRYGIPVKIRTTWFLSCEPFSTFFVCAVGGSIGMAIASYMDLL